MFNINSKSLLTCLIVWISLHILIRKEEKKKERRWGALGFIFWETNFEFGIK